MAVAYGAWQNFSRVWYEYNYTVSGGAAQVTVNAYLQMDGGHSSIGTYLKTWGGYWGSGSQNYTHDLPFGGSVLLVSWTQWVALKYGSETTLGFGATGYHYWGNASAELYMTLPPRSYQAPRPPLTPSAVRNSDTQATVTFGINADGPTGAQPWSGVRIDRWSRTTNTWVRVANVPWNGTPWVDKGITANNQYKYRVASRNNISQSVWVETGTFSTTPGRPNAVVATKIGSDVRVTWKNGASYVPGSTEVYDNGTLIATVGSGVLQYTHPTPNPAITHVYTLKAVQGTLKSAFSDPSNVVQLQAPPNAPYDVKVADEDGNVIPLTSHDTPVPTPYLTWTHNPVDSSVQTKFQIRYKIPGGADWLTISPVAASSNMYNIVLMLQVTSSWLMGTYEWQVRTKGNDPNWSPWSASASLMVEANPFATITSPSQNDTITTSQVEVQWSYTQLQGRPQQGVELTLREFGTTIPLYTFNQSTSQTSHVLDYVLKDGVRYQIILTAISVNGLRSTQNMISFYVDYLEPAVPLLDIEFDPTQGVNNIRIQNDDAPIPTVHNRVYRNINPDSEWQDVTGTPGPDVINLYVNPEFLGNGNEQVIYTNQARNTRMTLPGELPYTNDPAKYTLAKNQPVPSPHPDGILTAAKSEVVSLTGDPTVLSVYGINGRVNTETPGHLITLDVWVPTDDYKTNPSFGWPEVDIPAQTWYRVTQLNATPEGNWTGIGVIRRDGQEAQVGEYVYVTATNAAPPNLKAPFFFDGSESPDDDLVAEFLGFPYLSDSRLIGESVAGILQEGVAAIRSTRHGGSLRLIPTSLSNSTSYAVVSLPAPATVAGTVVVDNIQDTELTGALWEGRGVPYVLSPTQPTPTPLPNMGGSITHRITYSGITSNNFFLMPHGGLRGSGDVYYRLLTITDTQDYEGEPFSGSTATARSDEGLLLSHRWVGTPGASASVRSERYPDFVVGDWEFMGEYPVNANISDYEGLTSGRTLYLVEAISNIPSSAQALTSIEVHSDDYWIGGGDNFSQVFTFPYNITNVEGVDFANKSLHFFEGRDRPVLVTGEALLRTFEITATLDPQRIKGSTWEEVLEIIMTPGVHTLRDHDGNRLYVDLSAFRQTKASRKLRHISFTATEVDQDG